MNLDATQVLLVTVILASFLKDGFLQWYLIRQLVGGSQSGPAFPVGPAPAPAPHPGPAPVTPAPVPVIPGPVNPVPPVIPIAPGPVPVSPVIPAPVAGPRFTNIVATSFAGTNDSTVSKTSAYTGKIIASLQPGVALPYHFPGTPPRVRVFYRGKSVDCPVVDVGPWNTNDPYWNGTGRPQAESGIDNTGRRTNKAGIDLTPGAWIALTGESTSAANNEMEKVDWDFLEGAFASHLDSTAPIAPLTPSPPVAGGTVLVKQNWPPQSQAMSYFGNPASSGWEAANLVSVGCPWMLTVEGTQTRSIKIHRLCAASLTRVLNYIWEQCGKSQDQIHAFGYDIFDGSYNYRPIAGTSTLSEHAYGAALDFNAAANPQHATASQTKFKEDSLIVQAFKGEGWTWGGDWSPAYRDAMHFQALRT
jgi:hypothetical protein